MCPAKDYPSQFTRINAICHFAGEENGRHIVRLEHLFMRRHREWHLALAQLLQHSGIHKMRHHNVHIWLRLARLADDPFHPSHTFARRMSSVLIIVHRKFDEE